MKIDLPESGIATAVVLEFGPSGLYFEALHRSVAPIANNIRSIGPRRAPTSYSQRFAVSETTLTLQRRGQVEGRRGGLTVWFSRFCPNPDESFVSGGRVSNTPGG